MGDRGEKPPREWKQTEWRGGCVTPVINDSNSCFHSYSECQRLHWIYLWCQFDYIILWGFVNCSVDFDDQIGPMVYATMGNPGPPPFDSTKNSEGRVKEYSELLYDLSGDQSTSRWGSEWLTISRCVLKLWWKVGCPYPVRGALPHPCL